MTAITPTFDVTDHNPLDDFDEEALNLLEKASFQRIYDEQYRAGRIHHKRFERACTANASDVAALRETILLAASVATGRDVVAIVFADRNRTRTLDTATVWARDVHGDLRTARIAGIDTTMLVTAIDNAPAGLLVRNTPLTWLLLSDELSVDEFKQATRRRW